MDKVLTIDDSSTVRDLIQLVLSQNGYETLGAESGKKGLDILDEERVGLILLNLRLPDYDGWKVLDELDKGRITRKTPIMMITGEDLSLKKILRKDIEHLTWYEEKPVKKDELAERVDKIVNWWNKVRKVGKEIKKSTNGKENLSESYREWNRLKIIHGCLLKKLKEKKGEIVNEEKRDMVHTLVDDEMRLINMLNRKIQDILKLSGVKLATSSKLSKGGN